MLNPTLLYETLTTLAWPIAAKIRESIHTLFQQASPKPKNPIRPTFAKTQLSFNNLQTDLKPIGAKMVLLRLALSTLFKDSQISALISVAFNGKPFNVYFVPNETIYSEGECNFATQQIRIAKEQRLTTIISTLLFELCNASNQALAKIALNQFATADSYALAMEQAEYHSYQKHINLLSILVRNANFMSTLEGIGENVNDLAAERRDAYQSFDEYWQAANSQIGAKAFTHSEYYRRHYQDFTKLNGHFQKQPILVPGFLATPKKTSILASQFHSNEAKTLYTAISANPQALALLEQYQLPIAACLAKNANQNNLRGFKALNTAEQVLFITQFAKRNNQLIETHTTTQRVKHCSP